MEPKQACAAKLRVVIVGGGLAGLTLANALQHANIDYVVLERSSDIAPQVGASLATAGNGNRILDQLGVYEQMQKDMVLLEWMHDRNSDGISFSKHDAAPLMHKRLGYPISFLDRQKILAGLYDKIKDKSKIILGKKLLTVEQVAAGIIATCEDGSSFNGDIIVGADGVRSKVRNEMWRYADEHDPGRFNNAEKLSIKSEYKCLFGISKGLKSLDPKDYHITYGIDNSFLTAGGKEQKTYWFNFQKMDKEYQAQDIPRFSQADTEEYVAANRHRKVTGDVTLGDLWDHRISATLLALEEGYFDHWTSGRFVCVGDSVHKMTPNLGQGGNNAIESVAALANSLKKMIDSTEPGTRPSSDDIQQALSEYESRRALRSKVILTLANGTTRTQALRNRLDWILSRYIVPSAGDFFANLACGNMIGAEKLDYLPVPPRSLEATMPYNQAQGVGHSESKTRRALIALPLLILSILAWLTMAPVLEASIDIVVNKSVVPRMVAQLNGVTLDLTQSVYHIAILGNKTLPLRDMFLPAILDVDPALRARLLGFLIETAPIYMIWLFEAYRRSNVLTFLQLPLVFALLFQFHGISVVGPIYFFLHYIHSPIESYAASDLRLVRMNYAKSIPYAVICGYILPTFIIFNWPNLNQRILFTELWQLFPLWTAILLEGFALCVKDETQQVRLSNPKVDLPYTRFATCTIGCISAAARLLHIISRPASLVDSLQAYVQYVPELSDLTNGVVKVCNYDYSLFFASGIIWMLLLFRDLKTAGMESVNWPKLLICLAVLLVSFGPGATILGFWYWREGVIAEKKERNAIVATL
ncbi:unnamed protein product [Clonostachys solani]|uniref:FAD-binding domain-containing protein n=1 Tax=Clonostachys solani TaxID=160281 RepID=A0A9N9Z9I9_9HYPO|nr:unnamed protein product [Clonostachys solani]